MGKRTAKFSFSNRLKSFKYAFQGLFYFIQHDHNGRIHFVAALLAILLSWYLDLSRMEWMVILITITLVIVTEILNAALEKLADAVSMEFNPKIRIAKDLAAAAVLITAILSVIVAAIIFLPRLFSQIS